jgi:hypothetical protein
MFKIKNLTPHDINIKVGENFLTIEPESIIPRCSQETVDIGFLPNGIKLTSTKFGEVQNLPPQVEGTFLIVSRLVKSALPERKDLLVPECLIRNEQNHIIGCESLSTDMTENEILNKYIIW